MALCRSCSATIRFVTMESGKAMPVDAVPTPRTGTVAARRVGDRYAAGYVVTHAAPLRDGFTLFTPHWKDCDMRSRTRIPKPESLF